MNISIIYEDDHLLIINKPAGVVVNRAKTVREETIQDWLDKRLKVKRLHRTQQSRQKSKVKNGDFYRRSGIVHRLDKETSGILLIAKTPQVFRDLQQQFSQRTVKKIYLCLVHGKMPASSGEIRLPVGRQPWDRKKFGVLVYGKKAVSHYQVLDIFSFSQKGRSTPVYFSLVEVRPETGRTHQIRIHLKYLGHPVVSDSKYGGRKRYKRDSKFCPRMFLHAKELGFRHPITVKKMVVRCELPDDLSGVLRKLNVDCVWE